MTIRSTSSGQPVETVETLDKGSVFVTKDVETLDKGSVFVTKDVETQGKGSVSPGTIRPARARAVRTAARPACAKPESEVIRATLLGHSPHLLRGLWTAARPACASRRRRCHGVLLLGPITAALPGPPAPAWGRGAWSHHGPGIDRRTLSNRSSDGGAAWTGSNRHGHGTIVIALHNPGWFIAPPSEWLLDSARHPGSKPPGRWHGRPRRRA